MTDLSFLVGLGQMFFARGRSPCAPVNAFGTRLSTSSKPSTFVISGCSAAAAATTIGFDHSAAAGWLGETRGGTDMDGITITTERIATTGVGVSDVGGL